jgi:type IV secretion system protein VirB6
MSVCPAIPADAGLVRDILLSVDCEVQLYALAGYAALTGAHSPLPAALTAMMTIYVALLGYRLLFAADGARLSDTPLIAVKLGVILTLTLSWSAFQTLVFKVAADAPLQIARVISRPMAAGGAIHAGDPLGAIQGAYDELTADAADLGRQAGQAGETPPLPSSDAAGARATGPRAMTATALWRASGALLAGTVGVLAVATIAIGVLTAVGPLFIALFLFEETRGFFVGWVRALVAAMLAMSVGWITTSLLLVVLSPRIETLARQRAAHAIGLDTAAAAAAIVMIFAAAQALMVVAALLVAGGFQLRRRAAARSPDDRLRSAGLRPANGVDATPAVRVQSVARALERPFPTLAATRRAGGAGAPGPAGRDAPAVEATPRAARLGESPGRALIVRERLRPAPARRA